MQHRDKKHSKLLALALRHKPEVLDLTLDAHGWAPTSALLSALVRRDRGWTQERLERIVRDNDKQRFELSEDGTRIRARQGHTVPIELDLAPTEPPDVLFHGTAPKALDAILTEGLRPMKRHHVHLSADVETATRVGARRGRPVLLRVDAQAMAQAGHTFWVTGNGVWLCDAVPPVFLRCV